MSMLDAFFGGRGFKAAKCKTLLKLTIPRIKLLRNRRELQVRQMRRDIAKLLENGQEATARIRVEHIVREENMMAAQEVIELFCELISVRLPIVEAQRECPLDLKEAISSVCFAAPRCPDLPELMQVQMMFASKYGKEFVAAATELMPDCGVNRQIVELLSVRAPSPDKKLKLLKEIAEEHELDWDPAGSEAEFSKPHEDLLNGPSKLPQPDEKNRNEALDSGRIATTNELPETDSSADELDFPEVPKVVLRPPESGIRTAPSDSRLDGSHEFVVDEMPMGTPESTTGEEKQFLPFITPPQTGVSIPARQYSSPSSPPAISTVNSKPDVDLHDILVSAQAAAETAERAAAAARSAATIAQAKIKELSKVNSDKSLNLEADNPFTAEIASQPDDVLDKVHHHSHQFYELPELSAAMISNWPINEVSKVNSDKSLNLEADNPFTAESTSQPDDVVDKVHHLSHQSYESPECFDRHSMEFDSPHRELQRITSIDEDPYPSYPNLFGSSPSNHGSSSPRFDSDPRSPH